MLYCAVFCVVFIAALTDNLVRAGTCDQGGMDSCLAEAGRDVSHDIDDTKTIYDTAEKLNEVCGKIDHIEECVVNTSCAGHKDGAVDRYISTFKYICGAPKTVYVANVACFVSDTTRLNLSSDCAPLMKVSDDSDDCSKMLDVVRCQCKVYGQNCGRSAAEIIVTANMRIKPHSCARGFENNPCAADGIISSSILVQLLSSLALLAVGRLSVFV